MSDQDGDNFRKLWIRYVLDRLLLLVSAFLIASFLQVPLANLMGAMGVADWLFLMPPPVRWLVVLAVAAATWGLAIRQGGLRFSHFLNAACFRRPPLGALALVGTLLFAWMPTRTNSCDPALASAVAAMGLAVALGFSTVWEWLQDSRTRTKNAADTAATPKTARRLDDLTDEELDIWIENDDPIADSQQDLFDTGRIADRTCRALREDGAKSVALIGPYGCGKTSVVKMLENQLSREEPDQWAFCTVSGWGYDGAIPLIEQALEDAIEAISPFIDTANLRRIPAQYRRAMQACGNGVVAAFFELADRGNDSPDELLARIDQTLALANRKLVIVLEDLDRNRDGEEYWQTLLGFMDRLHQCHHLHFILNCGMRSTQGDEFVRICDLVELFPEINKRQFLAVCNRFRERWGACLKEHGYHDVATTLDGCFDVEMRSRLGSWVYSEIADVLEGEGGPSQIDCIRMLVDTPRTMKRWLSRTDGHWRCLVGEVDLENVVLLNALFVGAPEVYSFILKHRNLLRYSREKGEFPPNSGKGRERVLVMWRTLADHALWDDEAVWELVTALFPQLGDSQVPQAESPQCVRVGQPTDYLARAAAGELAAGELRDQEVIRVIHQLNRGFEDGNLLEEVSNRLCHNDAFGEKLRQFQRLVEPKALRPLAEAVIGRILSEVQWSTDLWHPPKPLMDIRAIGLERRIDPEEHETWIVEQLHRVLPHSLEFANTLYYFWRTQESDSHAKRIPTPAVRQGMIDHAEQVFASQPEVLRHSLQRHSSENSYWTLRSFVRMFDREDQGGEGLQVAKWGWLGGVILSVLDSPEDNDDLLIMNTMCLMCEVNERHYEGSNRASQFSVDTQFIDSVFRDRQHELAEYLGRIDADKYEGEGRRLIDVCTEWASGSDGRAAEGHEK